MKPMNNIFTNIERHVREVATITKRRGIPQPPQNGTVAGAEEKSLCPICKGAGFVRRDLPPGHTEFGRAQVCQCTASKLELKRQKRLYKVSNLETLRHLTFDSFLLEGYSEQADTLSHLKEIYKRCVEYAENPQGWLVLMGSYGVGKTHLAVAIANQRITQGQITLFITVPDLLDYLRMTYAPQSGVAYDERFDQVRNVPLLILDDLGTQATTQWAQEKLFQIINHRYNAQLPTVITTNQSLEEIDGRIRSRLSDRRLSQLLTIEVQSFRMQKEGKSAVDDLSTLPFLSHMTFSTFNLNAPDLNDTEREWLEQAHQISLHFAREPSGWLLLLGDVGVGKTHLAAAIANMQLEKMPQTLFIVVPDLLDHLRAAYHPQSTVTYTERFEQIRRAPLLVLDDLGSQSGTPWAQEKLFQLLNFRFMARLPTVITAYSTKQIEPRLLDRIMHMTHVGRGKIFEIKVPAYVNRSPHRFSRLVRETRSVVYR